jgi:peptidoglycan/LPS O-acetylase OafA/YrhL
LDGLRAFAVFPVLLYHGGAPGFQWGYIGVDFFFVLSGYLITTILLKEYSQTKRISLIGFLRRRALRLLPALAVLCLAFLLYAAFVIHKLPQGLKEDFIVTFYLGNWTRAFEYSLPQYLGHTWSLSIEEQFYIFWPLLLLAILTYGQRVMSPLHLIAAIIIAVTCWRVTLAIHGATVHRLYNGTDTRADALLIGAALALALATPTFLTRLATAARYLWLPAAIVIVVLPSICPWDDRRMFFFGFSVISLAAAIILIAALDNGALSRTLSNPVFVWIGQRSYGLYLWHYPIALVGILYFQLPKGGSLTVIEVACAFVFAAVSHKFIERPFLERRYALSRTKLAVATEEIPKRAALL